MDSLSIRVKQRRTALNLSQSQLASMVGMKQQSLHAIESGVTQRPRLLIELAAALECDPRWLVLGSECAE